MNAETCLFLTSCWLYIILKLKTILWVLLKSVHGMVRKMLCFSQLFLMHIKEKTRSGIEGGGYHKCFFHSIFNRIYNKRKRNCQILSLNATGLMGIPWEVIYLGDSHSFPRVCIISGSKSIWDITLWIFHLLESL